MNPRLIEDLLEHTVAQMAGVMDRSVKLLTDQDDKNVFLVTLFSQLLASIGRQLHKDHRETTPEVLVTTAMVLALEVDGRHPSKLDQALCAHRAMEISRMLRRAAESFPADYES